MRSLSTSGVTGSRRSAFCGASLPVPSRPLSQGLLRNTVIEAGLVGYGKKWEKLPVNKNNKVVKVNMHVKKGDHVIIIAGNEKGKTGDISRVCRKTGKVWIDGMNLKLRFKAPEKEKEPGTTYKAESPIHFSNVMHYSKEQQVRSRLTKKVVDGKKVRVLVKTGEEPRVMFRLRSAGCWRFHRAADYSSTVPRWVRSFGIRVEAAGKAKTRYRCEECGWEHNVYDALCRECGGRNTLKQIVVEKNLVSAMSSPTGSLAGMQYIDSMVEQNDSLGQFSLLNERSRTWMQSTEVVKSLAEIGRERNSNQDRIVLQGTTGLEVNRVLGGGIVRGATLLLGGDPGVGKSTLLLQIASLIAKQEKLSSRVAKIAKASEQESTAKPKKTVLYISGEESAGQIYDRAARLGFGDLDSLCIMTETNMTNISTQIINIQPDAVVMDSIQSVVLPGVTGGPGGPVQVRECGIVLGHCAKQTRIPIFVVGHVTKSGDIAGPKVLEHMVDVVLYLEGERNQFFRVLRSLKNRFGAANEIGIFEMDQGRMVAVENPNKMILEDRNVSATGVSSSIAVIMDGVRPMLIEIQALCTPIKRVKDTTTFQYGVNPTRLYMITSVLRCHVHCKLERVNLLVNTIGGVKLKEPAGDLAVAVAVASAYFDHPIRSDVAVVGELGLGGELRPVPQVEKRLAEVSQLGFKMAIVPRSRKPIKLNKSTTIEVHECTSVMEALELLLGKSALLKKRQFSKNRAVSQQSDVMEDDEDMLDDFEDFEE